MKVLFLTRYGARAASSRQRCFLYLESLAAAGIEAHVSPFLSERYVRSFHAGERVSRLDILRSYVARLGTLLRLRRYDVVWIEKEALPWFPAAIERGLFWVPGVPIVVDYDDATFHAYDRHRLRVVRLLLGGKIDGIMRTADLVIAGNAYIADRAAASGARNVARLPTAVDLGHYASAPRRPHTEEQALSIGWIGSPMTSAYLERLRAPLAELAGRLPLRMRLIGATPEVLAGLPVEVVPWSVETEAAELARCDVGIMPIPDQPWERGKCGYKLIQYMASGLPVVASPVGANREIVVPGETGFFAETDADWAAALLRLYEEQSLRERMGAAGHRRAEQLYSLQATAPRLIELLHQVAAAAAAERKSADDHSSDNLFRAGFRATPPRDRGRSVGPPKGDKSKGSSKIWS